MTNFRLSALGILMLSATPIIAQTDEIFELDELVFSTNLEETEQSRTGVNVSVVTEEELEQTADIRVLDLLARLPGVSIRTNGPLGTQAGLTIRGVNQTNIAVRVDGIDVADPSGTQVSYDFGGLTTSDLSRIEVVRGSQSALYGSEAIGGVINITTKRATELGTEMSGAVEIGSYNTYQGSFNVARKTETFEGSVTLTHTRSDGFSAADENDGNTEADGFEGTRLSFSSAFDLSDTSKLIISGFADDQTFDYDESAGLTVFDGTPDDVVEKRQLGLRTALLFAPGTIDHEVSLAFFDVDRTLSGTNGFGPFEFNYEGTRSTLAYAGATDLGAGRIAFGAEHVRETYADSSVFGSQSHDTNISSVFAEYTVSPNSDFDLSAALRIDDHSQFGGFLTGRLSGVWRFREDLLFRANLANGFRAPSNYELYDGFAGNAALQPETSASFDLGVEKRFSSAGYVSATAFFIQAHDIIDFSFATFGYVQRPGSSTRKGVEIATGWTFDNGVGVTGSYTYTDSQSDAVLDSSSWNTSVPRHGISATLNAPIAPKWDIAVSGDFSAGIPDLASYAVVNATVTYEINDSAEAYVRIENLFDREYQTVPGYGTSDRAIFAGLRARF